ncbi:hypothetical protein MSG28_004321 [Choristoneura fumiferana]|uniref:Uncharacterized protein n=1 Tax=Choristoneura fumiferana TaxID=7141 RepID=A0ACC0KJM8_CHOFU|nr:hypothetical protein MSG28_004321 [Choristoneura fumiferana]
MRAKILTFSFLLLNFASGQDATEKPKDLIKLCEVCTCSEIPEIDGTDLVFNIQCSELDRIENVPDLHKVEWPENPNGLKISAAFEGLGLSTLSKLPPNTQVVTLRFSNNAIKTYWPDPFSDVPNLKKLSFAQNDITEITPDLFTKIHALEDLDLSYNKLADFNSMDFKSLNHVRRLNLQSNQLKKIPVRALQPMTALEDLDLGKNGIFDVLLQRVDGDTMKGLKRLNLNGNRIRAVMKDSFPANNSIELLDMSNNIIEIIEPEAFATCTSLRELNLAQNNITFTFALPPTLQIAMLKLNTLYHWPTFPAGITYIDLSYNRLSELYDEIEARFDNLEVLNIAGNQINDLAIEKKLPKLFSLDISYNLFTKVPKSLSSQNFPNLEELRLDGNPMEFIYFKNIIAVKRLYVNELSKLVVVDDKAFSNVVGRGLDGADENCFSLFLSNCPHLSQIRDGAFDATSLCMLDLSKNNLTHLSKNLLDWSSVGEGVDLQHNPWHCNCDLQWLLDELLPQMYAEHSRLLAELRCGAPRAIEGLRLVHWYNWTEQAFCGDNYLQSGPHGTYMLQPSTDQGVPTISRLGIILGCCVIVALLIAIALSVYLVKSRKRYLVRQAALKRKRQSAYDERNGNGKEQFSALNKA